MAAHPLLEFYQTCWPFAVGKVITMHTAIANRSVLPNRRWRKSEMALYGSIRTSSSRLVRPSRRRAQEIARLQVFEHAVDAKTNLQPVGQHLDVDIARAPPDRGRHQLPDQDVDLGVDRLDGVLALIRVAGLFGQDLCDEPLLNQQLAQSKFTRHQ